MDIEPKDGAYFAGMAASFGGIYAWLKLKIKGHDAKIAKIERALADENGRPFLMSFDDHSAICHDKQLIINTELTAIKGDIADIKTAVKDIPKLATLLANLEGRLE